MNHLQNFYQLNNRYFALRHGPSEANAKGIIVSDPETGINGYGLTERGEQEVRRSVAATIESRIYGCLYGKCIIISSDFKRASKTAVIAHDLLCADRLEYAPELRERSFGSLEGKDDSNYRSIWALDKKNPFHDTKGVERADLVLERVTGLVYDLERTLMDEYILLVSHGDPIHILQTAFDNVSLGDHSTHRPIATAELRELCFKRRP